LLLYSYCCGTRSARAIERACEVDIAYRVIAAQAKPDHATIARFVERHEQALADLFGAVLGLCAQAGLAKVGIVAIDGTKVAANASCVRTIPGSVPARAWSSTLRSHASAVRFVKKPLAGLPRSVHAGPIFLCTWRPSGSRYFAYQTGCPAGPTARG
jgi:hypothetical protein